MPIWIHEFTCSLPWSPFFRPLAFVFQASQSVPRFVSLVFRRLKIRLRYEPSFIRRVIRQLVYNIFRCNDDLTSTDLSLSFFLSCLILLIIHHSTTDSLFLETPISVPLWKRKRVEKIIYLSEMYKYMFSIDLWFCFWREIFSLFFLSLSLPLARKKRSSVNGEDPPMTYRNQCQKIPFTLWIFNDIILSLMCQKICKGFLINSI